MFINKYTYLLIFLKLILCNYDCVIKYIKYILILTILNINHLLAHKKPHSSYIAVMLTYIWRKKLNIVFYDLF